MAANSTPIACATMPRRALLAREKWIGALFNCARCLWLHGFEARQSQYAARREGAALLYLPFDVAFSCEADESSMKHVFCKRGKFGVPHATA